MTRFQKRPWLLVGPALLLFLAAFVLPTAMLVLQSFYSYSSTTGIVRELTFANYARFFSDRYYLEALLNTVRVGATTAVLTLVLGFPFAFLLNSARGATRTILVMFLLAPVLISSVVRSFGWMALLGTDGLVNQTILWLGLSDTPVKLMFTETAAVLGLVHVLLVWMVIPIAESLRTIDPVLRLAAMTLGASPVQVFGRVILPLSIPGVLSGTVMVFSLCTGTFVLPALLGGPKMELIALVAYRENMVLLNWPFGAALAIILLVTSATLIVVYNWWLGDSKSGGVLH